MLLEVRKKWPVHLPLAVLQQTCNAMMSDYGADERVSTKLNVSKHKTMNELYKKGIHVETLCKGEKEENALMKSQH